MIRTITCLLVLIWVATPAYGQYGWYPLPWPERTSPPRAALDILDELAAPEVSGLDLATRAAVLCRHWQKLAQEHRAMADSLAELAAAHEEQEDFVKALALYELLWVEFPQRQDLIGEIKRKRALGDLPLNLSSPENALLSLKRSLLTYKLTAPTFGITDLDTRIYEPLPIERHEWRRWKETWKQDYEAAMEEGEAHPVEPAGRLVILERCHSRLMASLQKEVTIDFKDKPYSEAIATLSQLSGVPLVLTPEASRSIRDKRVRISLENASLQEVLKYILRYGGLHYTVRNFSLLVDVIDRHAQEGFLTLVMQQEPLEHFPDDLPAAPEEQLSSRFDFFLSALRLEELPEGWFADFNEASWMDVLTAPAGVVGQWSLGYSTAETGRFYGRVWPLFRCLRRYPLIGPREDWETGHPKKRYVSHVQLQRQVQGMQAFLDDRDTVTSLLAAKLEEVIEYEPHRFVPVFNSEHAFPLASRLGLWFDGKAYRFLLFDTLEDRARWLLGNDWVDIPSDLDDYDWPTEEEWQKQLEEERREFERLREKAE